MDKTLTSKEPRPSSYTYSFYVKYVHKLTKIPIKSRFEMVLVFHQTHCSHFSFGPFLYGKSEMPALGNVEVVMSK